jgi:transposase
MQAICSCGHVHTAQFPAGVNATLQYGPRAQAAMVHLNENHAVSVQRTAALMGGLFVLHADETGLRGLKKLHWLHVLASDTLSWMGFVTPSQEARRSMHGPCCSHSRASWCTMAWMPYKALQCQHGLCNAHDLRELTYLLEGAWPRAWAGQMIELVSQASHLDNVNCADGKSPKYS